MSGVAAVILAAGEGRRMGGPNKLLAEIDGTSMIRRVTGTALASRARPVIVVTGHRREAITAALAGLDSAEVHNPNFARGMATSLRAGIASLGADIDAALILLGDMPFMDAETIDRIIDVFETSGRTAIIAPVHEGRRGNPVLWPRRFFTALMAIEGDKGARDLIVTHATEVIEVAAGEGVSRDLDTPEAVKAAGGRLLPDAL
ncbi:nucleotidyltransferase family protein [Mesorhizobium sp. BR1-1-16]|uniref:nucleotidyltransferase family protein n=1 Tax=Mesorhizobium sp. BR1-1-16 TaxID=2876653 RepID=UPI001CCDFFA7|nr:nucleotidyltransferase family protein [Mesorhizobium sp. BR1-1-16]